VLLNAYRHRYGASVRLKRIICINSNNEKISRYTTGCARENSSGRSSISPRLESAFCGEAKRNWLENFARRTTTVVTTLRYRVFSHAAVYLPRWEVGRRMRSSVSSNSNNCDPLSRRRDAYTPRGERKRRRRRGAVVNLADRCPGTRAQTVHERCDVF